jgi:8-oxo-dGTP pyrophosphatase MutT (NUDIX family)
MFFPCCGVIILNNDLTKCVLVKTEKNNYGFPKGKRNKGETNIQTALRELNEETGINENQIEFITENHYEELSHKQKPSVKYYVAKLISTDKIKFKYDKNELDTVDWYNIEDAIKLLTLKNRDNILRSIINDVTNN